MSPAFDSSIAARVPDPMSPRPFRVVRRRMETADTFSLKLEPEDEEAVADFLPGQFNMLYLFGIGEVPISVASVAGKPLLHTMRAAGMVTRQMGRLRRGDSIGIRGPFGSHWPLPMTAQKDILIIAGGLGLAPLRAALLSVLAEGRNAVLLYGARSPSEILYARELERLRDHPGLRMAVTVDRATPSWQGHVGVVTLLIPQAPFDPGNCVVLLCGPEVMMRFVVLELRKRGVPETSIFLSMERNMKCAVAFCGHCQFGPHFICRDGPVFRYDVVRDWLKIPEL